MGIYRVKGVSPDYYKINIEGASEQVEDKVGEISSRCDGRLSEDCADFYVFASVEKVTGGEDFAARCLQHV